MAKGFAGTVFLTTDDCQASYEELKARGVEFTEAPEERPYGIDSGFRDPSGQQHPPHRGEAAGDGLSRPPARGKMGVTGLEPVTSSLSSWRSPN